MKLNSPKDSKTSVNDTAAFLTKKMEQLRRKLKYKNKTIEDLLAAIRLKNAAKESQLKTK